MKPLLCTVCLTVNENSSYGPVSVTIQDDGSPTPYPMPWHNGVIRGVDRYNLHMGAAPMVQAWEDGRVVKDSFREASGERLPMLAVAIVGMSSRCWLHLNIAWPMNDPYANFPRNLRPPR